jgi:hypothetical protein
MVDQIGGGCGINAPFVALYQREDQITGDQGESSHEDPVIHREFDELLHSVPLGKGDFQQGESLYQVTEWVKGRSGPKG